MDSMIRRELSARAFPGAAFLCGTADQTQAQKIFKDFCQHKKVDALMVEIA